MAKTMTKAEKLAEEIRVANEKVQKNETVEKNDAEKLEEDIEKETPENPISAKSKCKRCGHSSKEVEGIKVCENCSAPLEWKN